MVRLLHAMPEGAHRAAAALRHGFGLEKQAVFAMTRADVDLTSLVVRAHGTKTTYRDRQAIVRDDGCWAILAPYVRGGASLPDAKLFQMSAQAHADAKRGACAQLREYGVPIRERYTLHASRHSFAVEMKRRAHDALLIAANLGHADPGTVNQLYGKFVPRS